MKTENFNSIVLGMSVGFILVNLVNKIHSNRKRKQRDEERRKASSYGITIYKLPPEMTRDQAKKNIESIVGIAAKALNEETKAENN